MNKEPNHTDFQVWNEEIWVNVALVPSIRGKGNGPVGDYMSSTLYATI